jgi:hypothetical protein
VNTRIPHLQMKQTWTAARLYEKMVLRVNEWIVEQGYEAFIHVVEVSPHRYELQLLADEGVPRTPAVDGVIEFLVGMKYGDVDKGGSREARGKEWYASIFWGRSQAEVCMPLDKKGKYGWGPHKDKPFRLGRVEQHVTALRQWLREKLKLFDAKVANPMYDGWIDSIMERIRRELGRDRLEEKKSLMLFDALIWSLKKRFA